MPREVIHTPADLPVDSIHPAIMQFDIFAPETSVVLLTWVTFFMALGILYKYAWKPILTALDSREKYIRESLEQADQAREKLVKVNENCEAILTKADLQAKEIVNRAQKAAQEAAKIIEQKAREETQILLENANREIKAQTEKAQSILRKESAELAVNLAKKIIQENLDENKSNQIVENLIKDI